MYLRRLLIALGLTIGFLIAGAASALACDDPKLALDKSAAAVGETVPFTIINVDEGAAYAVTVAGIEVARGSAPGSAVRGSFRMPDLGGTPKTVYVQALVEHSHDGRQEPWKSPETLRYVVNAPTAQHTAPASGPAAAPAATNAGERPTTGQAAPASRPSAAPVAATPRTSAGSRRTGRASSTTAPPRRSAPAAARAPGADATARRSSRQTAAARTPSGDGAAEDARASQPGVVRVPAALLGTGVETRRPSRSAIGGSRAGRTAGGSFVAPTERPAVAAPARPPDAAVAATADRSGPSTALIAGSAALLGVALALLAHRRRRQDGGERSGARPLATPTPTPSDSRSATPQVEAALQELIAEQRAKELLERESDEVTLAD